VIQPSHVRRHGRLQQRASTLHAVLVGALLPISGAVGAMFLLGVVDGRMENVGGPVVEEVVYDDNLHGEC
jgi:hypothetical protein